MDHHCPWFATCIGFRNHKVFLLFLGYVSIFCLSCALSAAIGVYLFLNTEIDRLKHGATDAAFVPVNWIALAVVASVMGFAVTVFFLYSLYLAAKNSTVIENLEETRYRTSLAPAHFRYTAPPSSRSVGNIFDLGWRRNLAQIMGRDPWMWWIPLPLPRAPIDHTSPAAPLDEEASVAMLEENNDTTDYDKAGHCRWNVYPVGVVSGAEGDGTWYPVNQALLQAAHLAADSETQRLAQMYAHRQRQQELMREQMLDEENYAYYAHHQNILHETPHGVPLADL